MLCGRENVRGDCPRGKCPRGIHSAGQQTLLSRRAICPLSIPASSTHNHIGSRDVIIATLPYKLYSISWFLPRMLWISVAYAVVRWLSVCHVCPSCSCIWSKRLKIRPQLLWNANRKPYPSFRMVQFSMTLSDL